MLSLGSYFTFLSRNRVYAAINVFGLSVSLMFSVLIGLYVYGEYSTDSMHTKASRIYSLAFEMKDNDGVNRYDGCHHSAEAMLRGRIPEIESFCAIVRNEVNYVLPDQTYLQGATLMADSTFFSIFDFPLLQGTPGQVLEDRDAAVVSEEFARHLFGDENPVGKNLTYSVGSKRVKLRVTGVMGSMRGSCIRPADVIVGFWHAGNFNAADVDTGCSNTFGAQFFILSKDGTSLEGKGPQIDKCLSEMPLYDLNGEKDSYVRSYLIPLRKEYLAQGTEGADVIRHGDARQVHVLLVAGLLVLLFAVINYINLTVAQSGRRAREMAVRRLLGSQRTAIMCRLVGESVLMSVLSSLVALLLVWAMAPYVSSLLQTEIVLDDLLKPFPLASLLLFVLLSGVLSGIVPAVVLSRAKPIDVVRGTFHHQSRMFFCRIFIVFQNVVTITMVALSLLMLLQVHHLVTAPLGYNTHALMSIDVKRGTSADDSLFTQKLNELPCVKRVSWAMGLPLYGSNGPGFTVGDKMLRLRLLIGDASYADVLGLKVTDDKHSGSATRMYFSESLQHIFDSMSAEEQGKVNDVLAYILPMMGANDDMKYNGTMKDFNIGDITGTDQLIVVVIQDRMRSASQMLVETVGNETLAWEQVRDAYRSVYRMDMEEQNPYLDQRIRENFASQRRLSHIVLLFAGVAVLISFMGLLAMSMYFIQQRHREIAVRKVFGSYNSQVYLRLVRTFLAYVLLAFVISVPIIWYIGGNWLAGFSYRIALSPLVFMAAGGFCLLVSLAAVSVQSYMAANENPVKHLA